MKVLIFGASGFLGSHLIDFLKKKKINYVSCGRNKSNKLIIKKYNQKNISKIILDYIPDVIINLVAMTNVDKCELNREKAQEINTNVVKYIYEVLKKYNVKSKLIQLSTDQVYDGYGKKKENQIRILNEYAKSKYKAEKYVLKINGCVLRTNFFGSSENTLTNWIINSVKMKKSIKVFNNISFSPIYIKTLCNYIYLFCIKKISGVYNLGSKNCISKSEFAFYLIKKLNMSQIYLIDSDYSNNTLIAKRPKNMCMNSSKLSKNFKVKLKDCYSEINIMIKDIKK